LAAEAAAGRAGTGAAALEVAPVMLVAAAVAALQ